MKIPLFEVVLGNKASKQLDSLEPKLTSRLKQLFEILEQIPVPARLYDLKKIAGSESNY